MTSVVECFMNRHQQRLRFHSHISLSEGYRNFMFYQVLLVTSNRKAKRNRMTSGEYIDSTYTLEQLCHFLEWKHRNAFSARLNEEEEVELGPHRETLEKIKNLGIFKNHISIKTCIRRFQQWFEIYYDTARVAYAYIDWEAFVNKTWWVLTEDFKTKGIDYIIDNLK